MIVFILRRLAQAIMVMLTVAFIAFMLFQYVGDPVTNLLGQDATRELALVAAGFALGYVAADASGVRAWGASPAQGRCAPLGVKADIDVGGIA